MQEPEARFRRGRRFAHWPARPIALELRVLEADRRILAWLTRGKNRCRHHCAAVQHRRPAPDRSLWHGAAPFHRRGEKGRTTEGFRRWRANTLLLPRRRCGGSAGAIANCPKARGEIFNVGGTEETSILKLARLVVKRWIQNRRSNSCRMPKRMDRCQKLRVIGAPEFDDMRRRKPMVKKLERFVKFQTADDVREIIRLTQGEIINQVAADVSPL